MKYNFYTNSKESWDAIYKSIFDAKSSIYIEMYIVDDVLLDFDLVNLFIEKAKKGVKIKLILDSFGSSNFDKNLLNSLKENQIEVLFMSYLFHRLHKKIIIIDEEIAFIGGVNFHRITKKWKDVMIMLKGVLVKKLLHSFAKSYRNAGGKDEEILKNTKLKTFTKINNWIIDHVPYLNKFKFRFVYEKHINNAKESIVLTTPYLVPRRWLIKILHQAVLRGVLVEIIIPKNTDHGFFLDRINYFYVNKLNKLGVKIYLDKDMNHAKALLIDNKEGIVGSLNLDFLSFHFNSEIGVFFNNPENIKKLKNILNKWKKESELFKSERFNAKFFDYVISPIFTIFYRVF